LAAQGCYYRGQGPGHVAQAVEAPSVLDAHHDRQSPGIRRVFRLRHQEGPDIGGVVPGQAPQGLLPVPEGHAPDGQFQAPGLDDGLGFHESGAAVSHAGGQLVTQGYDFAFQFLACHGFNLLHQLDIFNINLICLYVKYFCEKMVNILKKNVFFLYCQ
jgi:hypothetical protein